MIELVYRWLPRIFGCHCRPDRSFHIKGHPFPLCARCTGELIGILSCLILFWLWKPSIISSCILMIPLILDGTIQKCTKYESTNVRRLITGFLFGIGITSLFVQTTVLAFRFGLNYGHTLKIRLTH